MKSKHMSWIENMRIAGEVESRAELTHKLPYIAISKLSEQDYCETKVDFDLKLGETTNELKQIGLTLHDAESGMIAARSEQVKPLLYT